MSGRQVRTQLVVWTDDGLFPLLVRRERREEEKQRPALTRLWVVYKHQNKPDIVCGVHSTNT